MSPDYTTYDNQRHSRHYHHTIIHIPATIGNVPAVGNNLEAKKTAKAKQLTNETNNNQNQGITQTVTYAIQERRPGTVLHSKSLQTTHQDTVGDDKTYVYRKLNADIVYICLQYLTYYSYQSCNNHQLNDNTNTVGDSLTQQ